ncbi:MAG TPA: hypothetical protein VKX28_24375 [Xanthobacteraceae bacterium]|nr:hypothetical protein [Xanthobacteraceae bacterium]
MPTAPTTLPTSVAQYLGPAPLNPGDDAAGYDTLLTRLFAEVGPCSVIEEGCLRDVADTMWDAVRLRRTKAKHMTISAGRGLREVLVEIGVSGNDAYDLSKAWAARELQAVGEVEGLLNAAGLDMGHVMAKTLTSTMTHVQGIDRMIAEVEARRAAQIREIALYREPSFAARLRRAVAAVEAIAQEEPAALPAAGDAAVAA